MNRLRGCSIVFTAFVFLSSAIAHHSAKAGPVALGPASDFNIFVFGDDTQGNSDTEGRVAVGGNANFAIGWTIGNQAAGNTTNLIVGGNLFNENNTVKGNVLVNGSVTWQTPTIQGSLSVNGGANFNGGGGQINGPVNVVGTYAAPGYFPANQSPPTVTPLPFSFASVKTSLQNESTYLSTLTPNGSIAIGSGLTLTGPGQSSGFYVFDVTGAQLAAAAGFGLSITAPGGSTVVVNVDGTSDSFQGLAVMLNGVDNPHVLYNFSQATSLTLNHIGVEGTILAPNANVNFAGGQINGSLIAQSVTGQGESHLHLFTGTLPVNPVPEPSTIVLAACGLAALVGTRTYRSPHDEVGSQLRLAETYLKHSRRVTHRVTRLFCWHVSFGRNTALAALQSDGWSYVPRVPLVGATCRPEYNRDRR